MKLRGLVPALIMGVLLGLALAVIPVGLILREPHADPNPDGVGAAWVWNDCFVHVATPQDGYHSFSEWRFPCP